MNVNLYNFYYDKLCGIHFLGEPFSGEFTLIVSPTTSVTVTARNCLGQTAQVMVLYMYVYTAVALVSIQVLYMYMYIHVPLQ